MHAPVADTYEDWRTWFHAIPISGALNLVCTDLDERSGRFEVAESALPVNPNGAVNGGVIGALVDHAMGFMATVSAPSGQFPATADLHVQYLRPAYAPLQIEATLTGSGRRLCFVEAVVRGSDGRESNRATGTFVVGGSTGVSPADPKGV